MKYYIDIYRCQPYDGIRIGTFSRLGKAREMVAAIKALAEEADKESRHQFSITMTAVEQHVVNKEKEDKA